MIKTNPEKLANEIGEYLLKSNEIVTTYNTVKGFLNITLSDIYYLNQFISIYKQVNYGHKIATKNAPKIIVEFSSPNTNKPLHLGHLRNIFLGDSMSRILEANGNNVIKTQIINDRGIHICKSMVAWKLFGKNARPSDLNIKGDQFVGKFYVFYNEKTHRH